MADIFEAGLSLGATYAMTALSLAFLWNSIGMLNMAQGSVLMIGGYASYLVVQYAGLPWWAGLPAAIVAGALCGTIIYFTSVRWISSSRSFDTNIVIATVGIATVVENLVVKAFSGYAKKQPFFIDGFVHFGEVNIRFQSVLNLLIAFAALLFLQFILSKTRMGVAIKAVSQDRYAAQLLGIPLQQVFLQIMVISSSLAAASGILVTAVIPLSPYVGGQPLLKAFIICVIAGLGRIPATFLMAFVLGWFEAFVSYTAGVRFGFPAMLLLVMVTLLWRPAGLFGQNKMVRQ
jgi:branched-chain amino acid transport system permease protein